MKTNKTENPEFEFFRVPYSYIDKSKIQDARALNGSQYPIGRLFIGMKSENNERNNTGVMLRDIDAACTDCALLGIYIASIAGVPGGRGIFPSIGGGAQFMAYPIFSDNTSADNYFKSCRGIFQQPNFYHLDEPQNGECSICNSIGKIHKDFYRIGNKSDHAGINDFQVTYDSGNLVKAHPTKFLLEYLLYKKFGDVNVSYIQIFNNKAKITYFECGKNKRIKYFQIHGSVVNDLFNMLMKQIKINKNLYEEILYNSIVNNKNLSSGIESVFDHYMSNCNSDEFVSAVKYRNFIYNYIKKHEVPLWE